MRYYSTQRPVMPGSFPKPSGNEVKEVHNYGSKTYCEEVGREAWGYIEYEQELTPEEVAAYELTKGNGGKIMIYTVSRTCDYNGMMEVCFIKKGSKYEVEFTHKGRHETTRKTFDSIYDALVVYEKYVEAFVLGNYSYEDRKNWLA